MVTTIGSLTNVPNAGAPISSPWAQDVTRLGVHVFATKAAMDAQYTTAANGATAITLDNGKRYIRLGGAWYTPDCVLARSDFTADQTVTAGPTRWGPTAGIVIPAGRRLELVARANVSGTGTAITLAGEMNTALITGGSRLAQLNALPGAGAVMMGSLSFAPAAGTHTFSVLWQAGTGSVKLENVADRGWFEIRDIGAA